MTSNPNPITTTDSRKSPAPSLGPTIWSALKTPIKSLSNISHRRRFECLFSLHLHSIHSLPQSLDGSALSLHWRLSARTPIPLSATRPAFVSSGSADFQQTLAHRCSVYASRASVAKYEPQVFVISVFVVGGQSKAGVVLGEHLVDLTRLLPLSVGELEEDGNGEGSWRTSFRLSGKAKGGVVDLTFGYLIVGDGDNLAVLDGLKFHDGRSSSNGGLDIDVKSDCRLSGEPEVVDEMKVCIFPEIIEENEGISKVKPCLVIESGKAVAELEKDEEIVGSPAKLLEDTETEALMHESRSQGCFCSPVNLPPEEPIESPSLGEGSGPFPPEELKMCATESENGNGEQKDFSEIESKPLAKEKTEEQDVVLQFKLTEISVAGLTTKQEKKKLPIQQQLGSRWLLAAGMSKSNKHPFMKSEIITKPSQVANSSQATTKVQPRDVPF